MLPGAHVSAAGGIDRAIDRIEALGGDAVQQLGVLLGPRAFRDLPAILETPGRDGNGPDALEMRRLRRVCREAGIRFDKRARRRRRGG